MTEWKRNEIVRLRQTGASVRSIARRVQLSRKTVQRVLDELAAERAGPAPPKARRPSMVDAHEQFICELLGRYADITARRVYEELRVRGYEGCYTSIRERVRRLRPRPSKLPVVRFETSPGLQAQVDFATYDIDFTEEGRRRVYLFGYVLGYSRRQYLHFGEAQDFDTTIREHVKAFAHLGGVVAQILYDNMKVVVSHYDADEPVYNARFLAFATHYGFKPWACAPRRAQTKGKVERQFDYVEKNLLNGRTFRTLAHLNEVTAWWLAEVADVRVHRETKKRPVDAHAEELPHLIPLPAQPYDTAIVVHRTVDVEGFIVYRQNRYSVPWKHIGRLLTVRVTEEDVIVYGPNLEEAARHRLLPRAQTGQCCEQAKHRPGPDPREREFLLEQRFDELGPVARRFLEGLRQSQRYARVQAHKLLGLLATYSRKDLLAALERAVRYGAFSLAAVERILAVEARPKSGLDSWNEEDRHYLQALLSDDGPVTIRPASEYHDLLGDDGPQTPTEETANHGEQDNDQDPPDEGEPEDGEEPQPA